jgi:CubicO group peptidase (beta-lactamase class C family)
MLTLLLACTPEFAEFDQTVDAFLLESGLEGATAVIVHRDEGVVHRQAYGTFEQGRISMIASSSKVMSVGVLMALHDEGALDIDAPVSDTLGDWGEHKTDITTAQLLSNSSGLVGLTDNAMYLPYLCQYIPDGTLMDCAEKIYTADDEEDRVPPDTAFRYGGGPWQLAGGVAEVAGGADWDTLFNEVYGPCGLTDSGYNNVFLEAISDAEDGDLTPYPAFFDGDPANLDPTQNPNLEGGGYTSVLDYEQILLMHLREGECDGQQVLSPESVARMQEDRVADWGGSTWVEDYPGYGLGWWLSREEPIVWDGGAYGATPWLDTERGYGVMILLEGHYTDGYALFTQVRPLLDEHFDG